VSSDVLVGLAMLAALVAGAAVLGAGFVAAARAVRTAAQTTPAIAVAILLAIVTLSALAVFALTGSETIATLAATGIGGLSAAVAAAYRTDDGGPNG
jgi:hypothetical protein